MAEPFKMSSTSPRTSEIGIRVLGTTSNTRRIIRPEIIENLENPPATVRITIAHQRKGNIQPWDDIPTTPLSTLKAGEEYILELRSEETLKLYEELRQLYAIGDGGVRLGNTKLVVGPESEMFQVDSDRASVINSLLSEGYSEEVWKALEETEPDLTTKFSYARIQKDRQDALCRFEANLNSRLSEPDRQKFFENNVWIFGYGLNYQFQSTVQAQPNVGGQKIDRTGSRQSDFLQRTEGYLKYSVLVEIKTPQVELVVGGDRGRYRNGAWRLGRELIGGVSQLQANCRMWEMEGAQSKANRSLENSGLFTIQPKGILVIGNMASLDSQVKRETFELFRRNLMSPEILTYDELYDRAKFIVERN